MEKTPILALPGVPRKDAYPTDNNGRMQQTLFFVLEWQNSFRKRPKPREWFKQVCSITHKTLLHDSEKNYPRKRFQRSDETKETTASKIIVVANKAEESPSLPYVTNFKGLLQMD